MKLWWVDLIQKPFYGVPNSALIRAEDENDAKDLYCERIGSNRYPLGRNSVTATEVTADGPEGWLYEGNDPA